MPPRKRLPDLLLLLLCLIILAETVCLRPVQVLKPVLRNLYVSPLHKQQGDANLRPQSPKDKSKRMLRSILTYSAGTAAATLFTRTGKDNVRAIGNLFEFRNQRMILQDVRLNVPNTILEAYLLSETFQQGIKVIRNDISRGERLTTVAFGPTAYESPRSFRPGVSAFSEDGGHATLTFRSRIDLTRTLADGGEVVEVFEPGNGLQFIKFGNDVVRVSKAIAADAEIKYSYGWIDLVSPSGRIPYEIVIGLSRDPLMCIGLKVRDMTESLKFFQNTLGMQILPFNYARTVGSNFEPQPPKGSTFVGYGQDSLGLLLLPSNGKESIEVGSLIDAFKIVVDESDISRLPTKVADILNSDDKGEKLLSPDGYPFVFQRYTEFSKNDAVKELTNISVEDFEPRASDSSSTLKKRIRKKEKFGRDGQSNS